MWLECVELLVWISVEIPSSLILVSENRSLSHLCCRFCVFALVVSRGCWFLHVRLCCFECLLHFASSLALVLCPLFMQRYCLFDCDVIHVFTLTSVAACVVCHFFDALPDLTSHFVFCGFQCISVVRVVAQLCFCGVEFVLLRDCEGCQFQN